MLKNKQEIMKYIDDELTAIRIQIEELDEAIQTFNSSLVELKKLVVSLIGGRDV